MRYIKIIIREEEWIAEIYETPTAEAILKLLPLQGKATIWGGEIYFAVPLRLEEEPDARDILQPGELAFWPVGSAFCIFFGPTPVSNDLRPRAYSAVNVFGKIQSDLKELVHIHHGEDIQVALLNGNKNHLP